VSNKKKIKTESAVDLEHNSAGDNLSGMFDMYEEQLMVADGIKYTNMEEESFSGSPWEGEKEVIRPASADVSGRRGAASLRPTTAGSFPRSRPSTQYKKSRMSNLMQSLNMDSNTWCDDASSSLTHGSDVTFAGNAALSMLRRQKDTMPTLSPVMDAPTSATSSSSDFLRIELKSWKFASAHSGCESSSIFPDTNEESNGNNEREEEGCSSEGEGGEVTDHVSWRKKYLQQSKLDYKVWVPDPIIPLTIESLVSEEREGSSDKYQNSPSCTTLKSNQDRPVSGESAREVEVAALHLDINNKKRYSSKDRRARNMHDDEVINLLKMKPRSVKEMQTKERYKQFFEGVSNSRIHDLLSRAYAEFPDGDKTRKVTSRLEIIYGK
jgi:hypothetical protein